MENITEALLKGALSQRFSREFLQITLHSCLKFLVSILLIKRQSCHHTETSQLICRANQLTGFYMMATLAFNELRKQI